MGDAHSLLVAIAQFLGEDIKGGTTGTRAATRAELCAACQSLALASLADSLHKYLVGDVEEHPHLQLVENPEPETRSTVTDRMKIEQLQERLDGLASFSVRDAINDALDEKLGTLIEAMQEQFKAMENQLKRTEEQVTDPKKFGNAGVMSRNAKRAGMTRSDWLRHCERTGHDPLRMDRSIPNHSPSGGRKKKAAKASSKKC